MTGSGLGGRNQELALAAAPGLEGLSDAAVFSFGSDGTDGPTDAALEALLRQETPKLLENARWHVVGGVRLLCAAAEETCRRLGYAPFVLTDRLSC